MKYDYYDITQGTENLKQVEKLINSTFRYLIDDFFQEKVPRVTAEELINYAEKGMLIFGWIKNESNEDKVPNKNRITITCCAIFLTWQHNSHLCGGLNALSVNAAFQKQGVAKELYKFTAAEFIRKGITYQSGFVVVPVDDEVLEKHASKVLIDWYGRMGLEKSREVVLQRGNDGYFDDYIENSIHYSTFCERLKDEGVRLFYFDVEVNKIVGKFL